MVRASRASQSAEVNSSSTPPPSALKPNKKRKHSDITMSHLKKRKVKGESGHLSSADDSDESPDKPQEADVKLEETYEPLEENLPEESGPPLTPEDANRILLVLDAVGPASALDLEEKIRGNTTSLRNFLMNPSTISFRALRERVRQQIPTANPRSAPADVSTEEFWQLAARLLDDVSASALEHLEQFVDVPSDDKSAPYGSRNPLTIPKYALYQHLPTGDYFTSAAQLTRTQLKTMTKGQSSFMEIHPTPALPARALPKLSSYALNSNTMPARRMPRKPNLQIGSAAFIDYGPFSSLAPSFDSGGSQISRDTLGLVATMRKENQRRRVREKLLIQEQRKRLDRWTDEEDVFMGDGTPGASTSKGGGTTLLSGVGSAADCPYPREAIAKLASEILAPDEAERIMSALDNAELKDGIGELLVHNGRALRRLQELQGIRIRAGTKGSEVAVPIGGEEWTLGREVLESLATVVSLRPRVTSLSHSGPSSLLPSTSALHALQQTVPQDATPGWRGTLSASREYALIDNTTIRSNKTIPVQQPQQATPAIGTYGPLRTGVPARTTPAQRAANAPYYRAETYTPSPAQPFPNSPYTYSQPPTTNGYYSSTALGKMPGVPNLASKPAPSWGPSSGALALPAHLRRTGVNGGMNGSPSPARSYTPNTPGSSAPGTPLGASLSSARMTVWTPPGQQR